MAHTPHALAAAKQAHMAGDLALAEREYRRLHADRPDDPEVLFMLGTLLLQTGTIGEAVSLLGRAAERNRNHPAIQGNLGHALFAAGEFARAKAAYQKAARLDPSAPQFLLGMANATAALGQFAEAETLFRRLAHRLPDEPLVWFNLGNVLRDQERHDEAIDCFRRCLARAPDHLDAMNNLASSLHRLHRFADAEAAFRRCLALDPGNLRTKSNLASVLIDIGRFGEAAALCEEVVAIAPDFGLAHLYLGAANGHQGRLRKSIAAFRQAHALQPDDVTTLGALGATLVEAGEFAEGLRFLAEAGRHGTSATSQLLSTALLARGSLTAGWAEYGARPFLAKVASDHEGVSIARELPDDLAGKHVFVAGEQGIGDEIFFLRYLPELKRRGARVTYRPNRKLAPLLGSWNVIDEVVSGPPSEAPDAALFIGDLPYALSRLPCSALPPPAGGYRALYRDFEECIRIFWPPVPASIQLTPPAHTLETVAARLATAGPPPYIALTWRAGTAPERQQEDAWHLFKEVPAEQLAAAFIDIPGTLVAIQRKPRPGEVNALAEMTGRPVADMTALNDDLESMLGLLALVDEYVTVSNTNVHLRVAAGRTCRVLVPAPPEWRWNSGSSESRWFPGCPIYRQAADGTWDSAMTRLAADLTSASTNHG